MRRRRSSSSKSDCERTQANSIRIPPQTVGPTPQRGLSCQSGGRSVLELCMCACVHNSRAAPDVKGRAATLQSDKLIRQVGTDAHRATQRHVRPLLQTPIRRLVDTEADVQNRKYKNRDFLRIPLSSFVQWCTAEHIDNKHKKPH